MCDIVCLYVDTFAPKQLPSAICVYRFFFWPVRRRWHFLRSKCWARRRCWCSRRREHRKMMKRLELLRLLTGLVAWVKQHEDVWSRENPPPIFRRRKSRKTSEIWRGWCACFERWASKRRHAFGSFGHLPFASRNVALLGRDLPHIGKPATELNGRSCGNPASIRQHFLGVPWFPLVATLHAARV